MAPNAYERPSAVTKFGFALLGAVLLASCTSDSDADTSTVTAESAYAAIVQWEVDSTAPVFDDDGDIEAPVVYLASGLGATLDAGVQAEVVSIIDDAAVIRFADHPRDARDEGLERRPVKDEGVMIVLDELVLGQVVVETDIARYKSDDDVAIWTLEITANRDGATVTAATPIDDDPATGTDTGTEDSLD